MNQWQPIDTAPIDGTKIDVWVKWPDGVSDGEYRIPDVYAKNTPHGIRWFIDVDATLLLFYEGHPDPYSCQVPEQDHFAYWRDVPSGPSK